MSAVEDARELRLTLKQRSRLRRLVDTDGARWGHAPAQHAKLRERGRFEYAVPTAFTVVVVHVMEVS